MKPSLLLSIGIGICASLCSAAGIPWPEHPRPDFQRSPWVNLNSEWSFAFDPKNVGVQEEWFEPGKHAFDRKIIVPFPWESKLSGIGDTEYKGVAWYSREITIPDGPQWKGKDAWLIIGACDWEATVWVNGKRAAGHVGGYLPFNVNLSEYGKPGDKVTVIIWAKDLSDPQQPTGKQVNWYTRTSGIWQTVYLEAWPKTRTYSVQIVPDIKAGAARFDVRVTVDGSAPYRVHVSSPDGAFQPVEAPIGPVKLTGSVSLTVKVDQPKLWSPDSPTLYPAIVRVMDGDREVDRLHTYFGLRQISIDKAPGRDYQYIHLNDKPIYLAGALHQSFHPDGIYQYPDDATIRGDYELCKRIGINMLRIHIKTPIPRELYWADKLGVLIMQDIPNFWQHSEQARAWYEEMLFKGTGWDDGAVGRDFNHPSIFAWVNFNETWGLNNPGPYDPDRQKWVAGVYERTKLLDPTRLVEDNSPCNYDHVVTDINSWHFYINDYERAKQHIQEVVDKTHPGSTFNYIGGNKQGTEPLMNSEYGGIGAGNGDQDISWCFKYLTNELRKHDKICGYIYTELSDIEWEHNGFVNYDRTPKEYGYDFWHPGFSLKDINNPDFVVIDAPPMIELEPDEKREIPILISHWSEREAKDLKLRWCVRPYPMHIASGTAPLDWQYRPATWKPFEVLKQDPIVLTCESGCAPMKGPVGALLVELMDGEAVLARNYVNLAVPPVSLPPVRAKGAERLILSFSPADYAEATFSGPVVPVGKKDAPWVGGTGAGHFQYELQLPEGLALDRAKELHVIAEMASRTTDQKLDWPARRTPHDRPQTDVKKWPSDLRVSVNGVELISMTLPDDPADARGALSHYRGLQGSWGYMIGELAKGDKLRRILAEAGKERLLRVRFEVPADAANKGGLTLYGQGAGLSGMPPVVAIVFDGDGHGLGADFHQDAPAAVNRAADNILVPIPTAQTGGYEWRYLVRKPPARWTAPDFDASEWRTARGGFGSRGTPNAIVGRNWTTPEIWLRTEFEIADPAQIASGTWSIFHDEDAEVYLNGVKILERSGYVTDYIEIPLDEKARAALKPGRNVLAVHCRQTGGGQNIDLGLTVVLVGQSRNPL